jgi:hypothetical protein
MFFLKYTTKGWNKKKYIYRLVLAITYRTIYKTKYGSGLTMDQSNRRNTPTKTPPVLQHLNLLSNTYYERTRLEEICLLAQHQASSWDYIELSIVQKDGSSKIIDGTSHRSTTNRIKTLRQHFYALSNIYYERTRLEDICLLAQHQASSCHYIELSIIGKMDLVK